MMKRTYLTFVVLLYANLLFGQEKDCSCIDDLDNTAQLIENAKSYKTQIKKGGKDVEFQNWKEEIKREIEADSLRDFFCAGYLQKYIGFINDRHNQIYKIPHDIPGSVPDYYGKVDTAQYTADEISGVYYAGAEKILVQPETDSVWYGILLESNSKDWPKGKIRMKLIKMPDGKFEVFEYYANGVLFYHKDIAITNGRIHATFWNKSNKYYFNKNQEQNFTYKSISPAFDYIGIKTLKRTNALIKEADAFYENTLPGLTAENLIIDLRNNGGGAIKQANSLMKYVKRNKDIKSIFVMTNFLTGSSAEIVALELKKDKRTLLVGENSRGMIAYGYGNRSYSSQTDCSGYKVVLSTTHDDPKLDKYEYIGLQPDIHLNDASDWIEQVTQLHLNSPTN